MFKILESIPKALAWLQIAAAPLVIGGIAGFFIYAYRTDTVGLIVAILTTFVGLVLGILCANSVAKKRGVVEQMARIIATPELDSQEGLHS